MHLKLNVLEDKLSKMKEIFNRQKEDKKGFALQTDFNPKEIKSNLFQNACEPFKNLVTQVSCPKNLKEFRYDPCQDKNPVYYIS